jgi:hypothetical protein
MVAEERGRRAEAMLTAAFGQTTAARDVRVIRHRRG